MPSSRSALQGGPSDQGFADAEDAVLFLVGREMFAEDGVVPFATDEGDKLGERERGFVGSEHGGQDIEGRRGEGERGGGEGLSDVEGEEGELFDEVERRRDRRGEDDPGPGWYGREGTEEGRTDRHDRRSHASCDAKLPNRRRERQKKKKKKKKER